MDEQILAQAERGYAYYAVELIADGSVVGDAGFGLFEPTRDSSSATRSPGVPGGWAMRPRRRPRASQPRWRASTFRASSLWPRSRTSPRTGSPRTSACAATARSTPTGDPTSCSSASALNAVRARPREGRAWPRWFVAGTSRAGARGRSAGASCYVIDCNVYMVALKRGKTIDFSDCDRYNSDCFECHQWLPFSHIPRVTGQRHAWQSTHRAAPMQTGHYARSADSFLGDHSGDHAQRVRARRFCLRAARATLFITASIAQCSQRRHSLAGASRQSQRPVSGAGRRSRGRRSSGLEAGSWQEGDGRAPAPSYWPFRRPSGASVALVRW